MKFQFLLLCLASTLLSAQDFDLKRLEGDWQNVKDSNAHEIWEWQGDTLIGQGLEIKNAKTKVWENLKIYTENDWFIYEAAVIGNKDMVPFKQSKSKENEILFSNPKHDFPNHIHYVFINPNHLKVEVYNTERSRVLEFEFKRFPKVE